MEGNRSSIHLVDKHDDSLHGDLYTPVWTKIAKIPIDSEFSPQIFVYLKAIFKTRVDPPSL